jgi:hypothetical protein
MNSTTLTPGAPASAGALVPALRASDAARPAISAVAG